VVWSGARWVQVYCRLALAALLGCGAAAGGASEPGTDDGAEAEEAEAQLLLARFLLPGQARSQRLELVDEIDAAPWEVSRRFQYRLLDYAEAQTPDDQSSARAMRRALTQVGIENQLFGLNLPAPLIEEAMWRAFAPRTDELGAKQIEELVESYAAISIERTPRARRDRGLPPLLEEDGAR
jgi:hypothetical protein